MNGKEKSAREFGRLLAAEGGPPSLDDRLLNQRQDMVEMAIAGPDRRRKSARRRRLAATVAAACIAAISLVLYSQYTPSSTGRIPFFVGDSNIQETEGRFISAGPEKNTVVRFDEGSRFEFIESAEARVVKASGRKVTIDLEQGKIRASVNPKSRRDWTVRAGPYQVLVKGTIFSVDWDDQASVLSVHVDRGRVAVLGPGLDSSGVPLAAGTALKADARAGRITFQQMTDEISEAPIEPEVATAAEEKPVEPQISRGHGSRGGAKARTNIDACRRLYRAKAYGRLLNLAEKQGFLKNLEALQGDDLWMFANASRYARRTDNANILFKLYRKRFPHANRSRTAAFLLAKAALGKRDAHGAKRWFGTYLAESPNGPLAEEALGHLMDIHSSLGNHLHAKRLAKDYLAKYQGGYFSKQAEKVLSR